MVVNNHNPLDAASIGLDDPVPLARAVEMFFPAGRITVRSLRTEIRKGRLVVERIAGKDFVTLRAIREMRKRCRVKPKAQGSTSASAKGGNPSGASETERKKRARAAAQRSSNALKRLSRTTSATSTSPEPAQVIRARF